MDIYAISSIIFTMAVLISYLNHRFIKMQTTTAITIGSLIFSFVLLVIGTFGFRGLEQNVETMLKQIPFHEVLINGMLSYLLFAGALRIDINHLRRRKWEISVLAILGTFASVILVASLTYLLLPLLGINISFTYCLLFGALISPTDPIAVISAFKELDAPKALQVMIEGESLFNDGVGIVIFTTIYQVALNGDHFTISGTSLLFLQKAIGGIIYGGGLGLLAYWLIKPINDHKLEILITLLIVTTGYSVARFLQISGPLAMVVAGIFIGNRGRDFSMTKKTVDSLYSFWEMIEEILNVSLFLLIGLELLSVPLDRYRLFAALCAIPLVLLVRSITVSIPMRFFKRKRKYHTATTRILIWGGLRGGLAFALALALPASRYRDLIITMTYAVVAFAVVVQGLTIKPLINLAKQEDSATPSTE